MTLPDPPLPLAQLTDFEVGETFSVKTSVDEGDTCYESNNVFIEVHDFDATLAGRSYMDVMVIMPTSPDPIDIISPDPLAASHVSSSCSPPSPSPKCYHMSIVKHHVMLEGNVFDCMQSLGTLRGYDPFLDPYSLYIGKMPVKILFTVAFNQPTDFSKACDKFRRALIIISRFIF